MKRSEAVNLIANMFYECNVDSEDADRKGEELLSKLEDIGMLAPVLQECRCSGHCDCGGDFHSWEKE